MKIIKLQDMTRDGAHYNAVKECLESGNLVCVPCKSSYRIVADLTNSDAVQSLLQSKHRTKKAPSLVFIPEMGQLKQVASRIPPKAKLLAQKLWPGELTILFEPNKESIPDVIISYLLKANGKLGVRIPSEPWIQRILKDLNRPLLVSSANRERKTGATSPAQVRKNFMSHVGIFIDAGDIPQTTSSTVVDFVDGEAHIKRSGIIADNFIRALLDVSQE